MTVSLEEKEKPKAKGTLCRWTALGRSSYGSSPVKAERWTVGRGAIKVASRFRWYLQSQGSTGAAGRLRTCCGNRYSAWQREGAATTRNAPYASDCEWWSDLGSIPCLPRGPRCRDPQRLVGVLRSAHRPGCLRRPPGERSHCTPLLGRRRPLRRSRIDGLRRRHPRKGDVTEASRTSVDWRANSKLPATLACAWR
jgi:hypothetical protein